MAGQSIKATPNGIKKAEKVLTGNAWSREDLAGKVVIEGQRRTTGINIQTIHKFFTGKAVARIYFVGICNALNLDWEQIAEIVTELKDKSSIPVQEEYNDSSLDVFVQSIKKTIESSIKTRKSHNLSAFSEKYNDLTLMLDPSKTIEVDKNYINIKLFQKNADSKQTIENTLFQEQGFNSKANQFQNNRTYAKSLSNPHFSVTSVPGVVRYSMNLA